MQFSNRIIYREVRIIATVLLLMVSSTALAEPRPPCLEGLCNGVIGTNQERILAILDGRSPNFSYNVPADPVTTREVTVTSASQFNSEAAIDGTRIIVGASFSGNVAIVGDDIDVLMDNAFTITGNLIVGAPFGQPNNSRIRWTGGNVGTTYIHRCNDVLVDDLYMRATYATSIEPEPKNAIGSFATVNRVAAINSTFRTEQRSGANQQWGLHVTYSPTRSEDIFLGNVKIETNQYSQNNRFHGINRLVIVDSVFNPDQQSTNGARFHETTDVWVRDTWRSRGMLMSVTASSTAPSVTNGLFDGFDSYGGGYFANMDAGNTGIVQNTTSYGYSLSVNPLTYGSGNVSNASWNGVTLPDSSSVGAVR